MARPTPLLAALILWVAAPLHAACTGVDLIDALPAADRAAVEAEAARQPFAAGNFWRVTRGDEQAVVVGTYHLNDPRHDASVARLRPIIESAQTLLVEASPAEEARLKEAMAKDPSLMLSDGPTLPERLTEDEWRMLSDALRARGIPPFMAAKFAPWYVSMTIAIPPCAMAEAQNPDGLDRRAMRVAEAAGVPIAALEPWDTVFGLFADLGEDEQLAMIRTALPLEDRVADLAVTLSGRYFTGESRKVWEYMRLESHDMPGYTPESADAEFARMEETLILGRNRAWIPVIETALARGPAVVAVGALHLPGQDGVLALLERRGFRVEPLTP